MSLRKPPTLIASDAEAKLFRMFNGQAEKYREYIQAQFNTLKWTVAIICAAGTTIFVGVFGKSWVGIKKTVDASVDQRFIDYSVDAGIKNALGKRIEGAISRELETSNTTAKITGYLEQYAQSTVGLRVNAEFSKVWEKQLVVLKDLKPDDIVRLQTAVPPGTIIAFAGEQSPPGWLLCDGTYVLKTNYPGLFKAIGNAWGTDKGEEFALPDLRGRFLRGVDGLANRDPDKDARAPSANGGGNSKNNVGSIQDDTVGPHAHILKIGPNSLSLGGNATTPYGDGPLSSTKTSSTGEAISRETRPKNAYVNFTIKF